MFTHSECQDQLDPPIEKSYAKIVDIIRTNAEKPLFVVETKGLGNAVMSSQYLVSRNAFPKSKNCWTGYLRCRNRKSLKAPACSSTASIIVFFNFDRFNFRPIKF